MMKFPVFQTDRNSGARFPIATLVVFLSIYYSQCAVNHSGLQVSWRLEEGGVAESLFRITEAPLLSRQSQTDRKHLMGGGSFRITVTQQPAPMIDPSGVIWAKELPCSEVCHSGTSVVVQWVGIHLPMQGTRVRALVQEDPTCRRANKPVHHDYWACGLEPTSHNSWARSPRARGPQQEKPPQWEARTPFNKG